MLLLADGSEVRYGSVGGPSLRVSVAGGERFGSCLRRTGAARLAAGYLPIVQTSYVDAHGTRYHQEAFAARLPGGTTAAYVRVTGGSARIGGVAAEQARALGAAALAAPAADRLSPSTSVRARRSSATGKDGSPRARRSRCRSRAS